METTTARLLACFSRVFPDLPEQDVLQASAERISTWDSLASITLLSLVAEEFGVMLDMDDLGENPSFKGLLSRLQKGDGKQ